LRLHERCNILDWRGPDLRRCAPRHSSRRAGRAGSRCAGRGCAGLPADRTATRGSHLRRDDRRATASPGLAGVHVHGRRQTSPHRVPLILCSRRASAATDVPRPARAMRLSRPHPPRPTGHGRCRNVRVEVSPVSKLRGRGPASTSHTPRAESSTRSARRTRTFRLRVGVRLDPVPSDSARSPTTARSRGGPPHRTDDQALLYEDPERERRSPEDGPGDRDDCVELRRRDLTALGGGCGRARAPPALHASVRLEPGSTAQASSCIMRFNALYMAEPCGSGSRRRAANTSRPDRRRERRPELEAVRAVILEVFKTWDDGGRRSALTTSELTWWSRVGNGSRPGPGLDETSCALSRAHTRDYYRRLTTSWRLLAASARPGAQRPSPHHGDHVSALLGLSTHQRAQPRLLSGTRRSVYI